MRVRYYSKFGYIPFLTVTLEITTVTVNESAPDTVSTEAPIDESNPEYWQQLLGRKKQKATSPPKKPSKYVRQTGKDLAIHLSLIHI